MTLEEINLLQIEDVIRILRSRVFSKIDPTPVRPDPLPNDFDYDVWYESQVTSGELDSELVLYKAELVVVETERLRKADLEDRFNSMTDMRAAFHNLHPNKSNPAIFLRDLLNQEDHASIESTMAALESKDIELKSISDADNILNVKKNNGKFVRKICGEMLDLIAGNNLEKNLTIEQIDQMEITYTDVFKSLQNFRPDKVKTLIVALTPDGVLVTDADKTEYLAELAKYGV